MNNEDFDDMRYSYDCKLFKKYAWFPRKVKGEWIFRKNYWIQYQFNVGQIFNSPFNVLLEQDYIMEELKGNIEDGKLLTTPRRCVRERD